ncbi:MAG: hypothetical protein IPK19_27400 [Chloroflexi bacterium]|nr:hypothetical protein [Chloroflexota bacterium]
MFATGRGAFSAILWDIHSLIPHEQLYSFDSSPRWAVRFSPDGDQLAVGTAYGTVERWDISTLKLLSSADLGEAGVTHLAYSPDGQYLAARTEDSSVYILPIRE